MKEKGNNVIENELKNISQKDKLNEEELAVLCTWYSRINKPEKIEQFESKLKKLNPNNEYFARQELQKFRSLGSIDKKIEFINELKEKGTDHEMLDAMINEVAYRYQQSGDFEKGWEFIQDNKEKTHPYRFYSYANGLLESNKNLSLAEEIAEAGVEKARKFYEDPEEKKPKTKTQEEWKDDRAYFLGNNLYAYGKLLLNKGNNSEALEKLEEAVKLSDRSNVDFNEYYAKALMETDRNQKVLGELKNFIKSGTANSKMRNMYKEAYVAVNGSEEGLKESLGELTSAADEKMTAELEEKMINKPAPNFTLTDLEGNKVSLNDYQGKTVVVDFWATWCGPCLQSFPGMKKAVQKYQDNKDVKFLFVNTWENVDDKKSNARQFIKKNDYPFHVLLDTENKVVTEFKVSGIPTKYIIDSSGNIRFKSVGFSGNTEHLVKELEVMIDLTKANS
jgi:peroxiredoxin/tetratricopeptide (TPR) repeat protein